MKTTGTNPYGFEDHNQNFWHLASIQSAAQGLPVILIGGKIAAQYGAGVAIVSILIGNLFLWLIGLSVISMTIQSRKDAIENVGVFLGRLGTIFAALILMIAFLDWYIIQIKSATLAIEYLVQSSSIWNKGMTIRLGAVLGLVTALLSIGGIRLIKWICLIILPFLFFFVFYSLLTTNFTLKLQGTWGFSLFATVSVAAVTLPGIINLPTFFRHSRSRADSLLALGLMTIFVVIFESFTILLGVDQPNEIFTHHESLIGSGSYVILTLMFIVFSFICVNLVNIYFASAGWEKIIPHIWTPKEYAIVGLIGTAAYTFFQVSGPMEFLERLANSFISSLGMMLLLTFLVRLIVKHRSRPYEKVISGGCWLAGCFTSVMVELYTSRSSSEILIAGLSTTALTFLLVIFVEETIWSFQRILHRSRK